MVLHSPTERYKALVLVHPAKLRECVSLYNVEKWDEKSLGRQAVPAQLFAAFINVNGWIEVEVSGELFTSAKAISCSASTKDF